MDSIQKLMLLGQSDNYELDGLPLLQTADSGVLENTCGANNPFSASGSNSSDKVSRLPVFFAAAGGKRIPILKTVLTSVCERDCNYCGMRSGIDCQRYSFRPEEMAKAFLQMYSQNIVRGIFLSSGIAGGGVSTQDRLLITAEILRKQMGFRGYLHLKIMPGSEQAQIERALQLADRVSVNLETTSTTLLHKLAPQKRFLDELLQPLKWVDEIRQKQSQHTHLKGCQTSSTTQFVVGPAGETDFELLHLSSYLYNHLNLSRVYYSRFNPIPGTPLENEPGTHPKRQARLYQASFLLRDYGYDVEDFNFIDGGFLPLDRDPKVLWAEENLREKPVEINRADYSQLLRIPGIGPKGARRIIEKRNNHKLVNMDEIRSFGIRLDAARPFLLVNGKRMPVQMELFG